MWKEQNKWKNLENTHKTTQKETKIRKEQKTHEKKQKH